MADGNITIIAFAIIDTNVIVASMLGNKDSATKEVMNYVECGNIIPLFDERIIREYFEVLSRFFTDDIVEEKLSNMINNGILVTDIEETKEYFKDKADIPFFEVKESARELDPYLITGNEKDFPENTTKTPAFVIEVLKYLNNFIIRDKEKYINDIGNLIEGLDDDKYILGWKTDILSNLSNNKKSKDKTR